MTHSWDVTPWPVGEQVSIKITDDDTGQWATVTMDVDQAERVTELIRQAVKEARGQRGD